MIPKIPVLTDMLFLIPLDNSNGFKALRRRDLARPELYTVEAVYRPEYGGYEPRPPGPYVMQVLKKSHSLSLMKSAIFF